MAVTSAFKSRRAQRRGQTWSPDPRDGRRRVLHVGCGPIGATPLMPRFQGPDWVEVRLDLNPDVEPDIVANIVDMSPVPDESVHAVMSSHNVEHVFAHQVPLVLSEFRRVLVPGGEALIGVPNLEYAAQQIIARGLEGVIFNSDEGPITPLDMLYGYGKAVESGNEFMAHRTGFTRQTLERRLHAAGFAAVEVQVHRDALWAVAFRGE